MHAPPVYTTPATTAAPRPANSGTHSSTSSGVPHPSSSVGGPSSSDPTSSSSVQQALLAATGSGVHSPISAPAGGADATTLGSNTPAATALPASGPQQAASALGSGGSSSSTSMADLAAASDSKTPSVPPSATMDEASPAPAPAAPSVTGSASGSSSGPAATGVKHVVVVGAGVIGAATAYYLTERGVAVTVVERCGLACHASGKAAGFLAADWNAGLTTEELARCSFDLHVALERELGGIANYGFRRLPTISLAASYSAGQALKKRQVWGEPGVLDAAGTRGAHPWLDGDVIAGSSQLGTEDATAQLNPGQFTKALMDRASTRGAKLTIGCVNGVTRDATTGRVNGVDVDGTVIPADAVVLAMGVWTTLASAWFSDVTVPVVGLKAHSIVMRPESTLVGQSAMFVDFQNRDMAGEPEVYPRPDGEVYACGECENVDVPADPAEVTPRPGACERLKSMMDGMSSVLAAATVRRQQACFLPNTPDGLPIMGPIPGVPGAYIATGHGCWGILNSPGTGLAMAELIADGVSRSIDITPFSVDRFC